MSEIKFRLAKPSDAMQIAEVHYHVRDEYGEGFFAHVNKDFLKQYYKIILNDPYQIVVCAELDHKIIGFSSGSLDVSQEFKGFRKHKWRFVWPLFMTALLHCQGRARPLQVYQPQQRQEVREWAGCT